MKIQKNCKFLFSLLLILTMLFSLFPLPTVSAAQVDMNEATVVTDIAGFIAAMSAGGNVKIVLGADITLPTNSSARIPATVNSLTIDGGSTYSLYDRSWLTNNADSTTGNLAPNSTATTKITFQNINLYVGDFYGIACALSNSNLTITFDNCLIECRQLIYAPYSSVVIRNCDISTKNSPAGSQQEIGEIGNLTIGGNTRIVRGQSTSYELFDISSSATTITIEDNAYVEIDTTAASTGRPGFVDLHNSNVSFTIGKNATFVYKGNRFWNGGDTYRLKSFTCGEKSTTVLAVTGPLPDNEGIINVSGAVTVNKGASLYVMLKNSDTSGREKVPVWFHNGSLVLNNPKTVVLYNGGNFPALSAYSSGTNSISFHDINGIRFYNSVSSASFDFDNPINSDGTVSYSNAATPNIFWATSSTASTANQAYLTTAFNLSGSVKGSAGGYYSNYANATITNQSYTTRNIMANAQDSLNSFSTQSVKIIEISGSYSEPPIVDSVVEGMKTITGTGVPGSEITISSPATGTMYAIVDSEGNWSAVSETAFVWEQTVSVFQREQVNGQFNDASDVVTTVVLRKSVNLIPTNNTSKTYSPDMLGVGININNVDPALFTVENVEYIILDDPDALETLDASPDDPSVFGLQYSAAAENHRGTVPVTKTGSGDDNYNGSIGQIKYNCGIWVRATLNVKGETLYVYDSLVYKNIYTPVTIQERGVITGTAPVDKLYDYQAVNGTYGIPYKGDGVTVYQSAVAGFDTVSLTTNSAFSSYWTATTLNGDALPYTLTLNGDFLDTSINTLCDDDSYQYTLEYTKIPSMWKDVTVYYRSEEGAAVGIGSNSDTTGTINVPLTAEGAITTADFYQLGGKYTPPSDTNDTPIGWLLGSTFVGSSIHYISDFSSSSFNPIFTNLNTQKLYIIYKVGQFTVSEQFKDGDGNTLDTGRTLTYDVSAPEDYGGSPKKISGYVPVGYTVSGSKDADNSYTFDFDDAYALGADPTANQYDLFEALHINGEDMVPPSGSGTVTITYVYKKDSNNNGIADSEETSVAVSWYGYKLNSAIPALIQNPVTVYSRMGDYSLDICNLYPDTSGSNTHMIVLPSYSAYAGTWIFDQWIAGNDTVRTVTMDGNQSDIAFVYGYATDGSTLDNRQYVTEKFYLLDEGDDNATAIGTEFSDTIITSNTKYNLKTKAYTNTPAGISGYVYVGYRIEDQNGNAIDMTGNMISSNVNTITYENGKTPAGVIISIDTQPERYAVVYLYRKAAEPVTVTWLGNTYAGNETTLGSITKNGYIGESFTIDRTDFSIDSYWAIQNASILDSGGNWQQQSDNSKLTFTLGSGDQQGRFYYEEKTDQVIITTEYKSEDDSLNFKSTYNHLITDPAYTINAMTLNGYELTGWTLVDRHGTVLDSGDASTAPVTVDPAVGTQTLTFTYKSTLTSLYIRCYDSVTGAEIDGTVQKYDNVLIGDTFYVRAPVIPGYELASGETLIKSKLLESGTNTIRFYYSEITGGTLILREGVFDGDGNLLEAGQIIQYRNLDIVTGAIVPIPDLSSDFYTALSTDVEPYSDATKPITYYYTKDLMNVEIQAVDKDDPDQVLAREMLTSVARKGEMYLAVTDLSVTGYTLSGSTSKYVYADPGADAAIRVPFNYKADMTGDITVSYHYYDKDNALQELKSFTVTAVVGSKFTANATNEFEGFVLANGGNGETKEIIVSEGTNEINFLYNDIRKTVTVYNYTVDSNGIETLYDTEYYYFAASATDERSVTPKYISDHILAEYKITSTGSRIPVTLDITNVNIGSVMDDTEVYLYYGETGTVISKLYSSITVKGIIGTTELYNYEMKVLADENAFDVRAFLQDGKKVNGASIIKNSDGSDTGASLDVNNNTIKVDPADGNQTVKFFYETLSRTVTIKAVDDRGEQLKTPQTVTGYVDDTMTINAPVISGYVLDNSVDNNDSPRSYTVVSGTNEVTFTYKKASGNVLVNFIDTSGNLLHQSVLAYDVGTAVDDIKASLETDHVPGYTNPTWQGSLSFPTGWTFNGNYETDETLGVTGSLSGDGVLTLTYELSKVTADITVNYYLYNGATTVAPVASSTTVSGEQLGSTVLIVPNPTFTDVSKTYGYVGYGSTPASSTAPYVQHTVTASGNIVNFYYEEVTSAVTGTLTILGVDESDNSIIIFSVEQDIEVGTAYNALKYLPITLTGWKQPTLQSGSIATGTMTASGSTVIYEYAKDAVDYEIYLVDVNGDPVTGVTYEDSTTNLYNTLVLQKGTNEVIYPPVVDGYVMIIDGSTGELTDNTILSIGTDGAFALENISQGGKIIYIYQAIEEIVSEYTINIKVRGETTVGDELYRYDKDVVQNSGQYTISAFEYLPNSEVALYEVVDILVNGASQGDLTKVDILAGEEDIEVVFVYQRLGAYVTINMVDADTGSPITSNTLEEGIAGKPFTFNAPSLYDIYLSDGIYYYLVDWESSDDSGSGAIGKVDSVESNGSSYITFFYREVTCDIIFVAKEEDSDGHIIRIVEIDSTGWDSGDVMTEQVPDLSEDYYTFIGADVDYDTTDNNVTFEYIGNNEEIQIIELYYAKNVADITIEMRDSDDNSLLGTETVTKQRIGEAVAVYAPKLNHYSLDDDSVKVVMVEENSTSVTFWYKAVATSGTMTVKVTASSDGNAISGAIVTVKNTVTDTITTIQTNSSGLASLTGLPFGVYSITVNSEGYNSSAVTYSISSSAPDANIFIGLGTTTKTTGGGGGGTSTYTVTYNANGGTGSYSVTGISSGSSHTVLTQSAAGIARDGYIFAGWSIQAGRTAYNPDDTITVTGNVTLYAQWIEDQVTPGSGWESKKHIVYLYGYPDGSAGPDRAITRAEAAAIFYRLLSNPTTSSDERFSDVTSGVWYAQAVNYLTSIGILTGYPDGAFRPEAQITRAEFATIASRFESLAPTGNNVFNDVPDNHWAISYINTAYAKNWVTGYPDGTFRPENNITRTEVVTIVNAMRNRKIDDEALAEITNPYNDISSSHWAYAAIIEASIAHDYTRDDSGIEIWHN